SFYGLARSIHPYILGADNKGNFELIKEETRLAIIASGLQLVGDYKPARDPVRYVFTVTSPELKNAINNAGTQYPSGLAARIALTIDEGIIVVSATNPIFWGKAYFGNQYTMVANDMGRFDKKLDDFFHIIGKYKGLGFGAIEDLSDAELSEFQ